MPDEFRTFLSNLQCVTDFGVDRPDPMSTARGLNTEAFFDDLYEERGGIDQLLNAVEEGSRLVCLVAPRGSGKTTLVHKLKRELDLRNPHRKMILIDVRNEINLRNIDVSNDRSMGESLRSLLRSKYLNIFFRASRNPDNARLKLYAFLLDSEKRDRQPEQIFSNPIFALQDEANILLQQYDAGSEPLPIDELLIQKAGHKEVAAIKTRIDKEVTFSQLAHSAYALHEVRDQVIWLDNVDRLTDQQQIDAFNAINSIFAPVASLVRMGLSIREENVYREFEQGAPPKPTRIMLKHPDDDSDRAYYPSEEVPLATAKTLQGMMERRLRLARKMMIEGKLADNLGREDVFKNLLVLTNRLIDQVCDENAVRLTNNCLRDFMELCRHMLGDLVLSNVYTPLADQIDQAIKKEDWYIRTVFLWRLRHAQEEYKIGIYDVLAAAERHRKRADGLPGCMLEHLVLTKTWNLTLRSPDNNPNHGGIATVGDVVRSLERLGYVRDAVVEAMHGLYWSNGSRQHLLEIRNGDVLKRPSAITDDLRIYLTLRGKCLTASASGSFAYLYDCLRILKRGPQAEQEIVDEHEIRSTAEIIDKLIPHLCDIAQMHYDTLNDWFQNGILSGDNWLEDYKKEFGAPIGILSGNIDTGTRYLQLEMILSRLIRYPKNLPNQLRKLHALQAAFLDELAKLKKPEDVGLRPNFRKIIGV
jgi:hypothetical protein